MALDGHQLSPEVETKQSKVTSHGIECLDVTSSHSKCPDVRSTTGTDQTLPSAPRKATLDMALSPAYTSGKSHCVLCSMYFVSKLDLMRHAFKKHAVVTKITTSSVAAAARDLIGQACKKRAAVTKTTTSSVKKQDLMPTETTTHPFFCGSTAFKQLVLERMGEQCTDSLHSTLFVCDVCGYRAADQSKLNQHSRGHKPGTHELNQCRKCSVKFGSGWQDKLMCKNHEAKCSGQLMLEGLQRPAAERQDCDSADSGIAADEPDVCFVCEFCHRMFLSDSQLQVHITSHLSASQGEKCSSQGEECSSTMTSEAEATIADPVSPVSLTSEQAMIYSLHSYSSFARLRLKLTCRICWKLFGSCLEVSIHELSHKTVKCKLCNKWFSRSYYKRHHRTSHLKGKVQCRFCSDRFMSKKDKIEHCKVSHLIKLYKCGICKEVFDNSVTLRSHFKYTHGSSNGSPFECVMCTDTFVKLPELMTHMHQRHSAMPRLCAVCGRYFCTRSHKSQKPSASGAKSASKSSQ